MKLLLITYAAILMPLAAEADSKGKSPPNVLFLLSDDQRADTVGEGSDGVILTPHLDNLAQQSTVFRNAFVTTSVCAVSRACILMGQYAHTTGVEDFATPLSPDQHRHTWPAILKEAGYYTGFIGKWGIGADDLDEIARAGEYFDYWAGYSHQGNYWHDEACPVVDNSGPCTCATPDGKEGYEPRTGFQGLKNPVHLTTSIVPNRVREFLNERDTDKPFCLSISFKAPHAPWQDSTGEMYELYDKRRGYRVPETATPEQALSQPDFLRHSLEAERGLAMANNHQDLQWWIRLYYQLITDLDQSVGDIRQALEEAGVAGSTIIVFTSDNGHLLGEHGLFGKWLMHEPSIRVPLLIHDPTHPDQQFCDEMVLNIDLGPTVLDLAGVTVPDSMDGKSLAPLLKNTHPDQPFRDDWYYEHHFSPGPKMPIPASEGIRTRKWKYIRYVDQKPEVEYLFNLETDPQETTNVAMSHPEVLARMRTQWMAYRLDLK